MIGWLKKLSSRFDGKKGNFFLQIRKITGYPPKDESYYHLAFRHSSASHRNNGLKLNNQRLEYLGDAILGAVVADFLYQKYPDRDEGFLTNLRSKIVSRKHLNQTGMKMGLKQFVVKKTARTIQAKSIYGDALEALIGALYLDRGYLDCHSFITEKLIKTHVDLAGLENRVASHKGVVLEWGQKLRKDVNFEITGCYGESHARKYEVTLKIDGEIVSTGKGSSKKKAEEDASKVAYKKILK